MANTAALISGVEINESDMANFLEKLGAVPVDAERFALTRGEAAIWIYHDPDSLSEVFADSDAGLLERRLGSPPKSCFIIEISRSGDSDILATDFALKFMNEWPAVYDNFSGNVYGEEDLRRRLHQESTGRLRS